MTIDDRTLGNELIRRGLVDAAGLQTAQQRRDQGAALGQHLVDQGVLTPTDLAETLRAIGAAAPAAIAIDAEPAAAPISVGAARDDGTTPPAAIAVGSSTDAAAIAIGDDGPSEDSAIERAWSSVDEASVSVKKTGPFREPATPEVSLAQKIEEKRVTTAAVLGIGDAALDRLRNGEIDSTAVSRQITRFLKRLQIREQQISDLKTCKAELPDYGKWLIRVERVGKAADAAAKLLTLIDAEREEIARADLWNKILVYLDDAFLEWAEHKKTLWNAEQLGLTEGHVEELYARWAAENGNFKRETEQEAASRAHSGWRAHPKLAGEGEVWAWNLKRLQDALLQRFTAGIEVANMAPEWGHSLAFYIDQWEPKLTTHVERAIYHATDLGCPQLAVWYFLWATGQHELHVGGGGLGPVAEQRRCVNSLDALIDLVRSEWVVDDLGELLACGFLEHWLKLAAGASKSVVDQAASAREQAKRQVTSEREAFLRREVTRLLWKMGFEGMPLLDSVGQPVIVGDIPAVLEHAEACWEDLEWCLEHKVLEQWLNTRDLDLANWARRCARLS